jgi:hypothetical protein
MVQAAGEVSTDFGFLILDFGFGSEPPGHRRIISLKKKNNPNAILFFGYPATPFLRQVIVGQGRLIFSPTA